MYFSVLGELAVSDGERLCTPHRAKLRDLLALLLVDAGREVSRKRLVADLWDHNPPATAESALYSYVSQLREEHCVRIPRVTLQTGYFGRQVTDTVSPSTPTSVIS